MPRRLIALVSALALAGALAAGAASSFGAGTAAHPEVIIGKAGAFTYSPKHLSVKRGTRVRFAWSKANIAPHNVHIYKAPRGVRHVTKGGRRGKVHGRAVGITFRKLGTYKLECTIHPFMKLSVRVHR